MSSDKEKLKEHYAGLAMQALLSNDYLRVNKDGSFEFDILANMAINQADALIEELNKDKEDENSRYKNR